MGWESALDRLLLQQVHLADKGEAKTESVRQQLLDYWQCAPQRPGACFLLGYARTLLGVELPATGPHSGGNYLRHTPRRELDIAVVGVASQLTLTNGVCTKARIALAAVAPVPLRATAAERALEGQAVTPDGIARAADLALEAARPISDQRGSADFRRHLVRVLTRRTLTTALARASA